MKSSKRKVLIKIGIFVFALIFTGMLLGPKGSKKGNVKVFADDVTVENSTEEFSELLYEDKTEESTELPSEETTETNSENTTQEITTSSQSIKETTEKNSKKKPVKKKKGGKWKIKKGCVYYIRPNGKKTKGFVKIKKKKYYFDKKGVQHNGWQKVGKNYYYFKNKNGKKGFMVTSKKINGIKLKKNGKAKLTAYAKKKLNVLIKAQKIVEKCTKPTMKRYTKLKKVYQYALKHFRFQGSPTFHYSSDWDMRYALQMFDQGHGACYAYGGAFAYLANAVGYNDAYIVSSGGHGWAQVKGNVFDVSWERADSHSYFDMDYSYSGIGGRPNYAKNRKYMKRI